MTRIDRAASALPMRSPRAVPAPVNVSTRRLHPAKPRKAVGFGRARLSHRTLALITRQLATLTRVMTVEEALRTIAVQVDPSARRVLLSTHAQVTEGYRLSDAMARQGASFPALYRAMIAAGEASGALPEILDRLADLLEREQLVRSKMLTTMIYPAALCVTAIGVIVALMTFVVPRVVDQFSSMGQTLPALTRTVIFTSDLMTQWGWLILLTCAVAFWVAILMLRNPALRRRFDAALLRLPLVGRLVRDLNAARLARTLATMIAAGLPVVEGLMLTARTINNRVLRDAIEAMAGAIREGCSVSGAMRRTAVFPPVVVNMTASGESSGKLDTLLGSAADYLEREFNTFTSIALSLLEPIIIIVMGAIVAMIVLAILLPILQINTLSLR